MWGETENELREESRQLLERTYSSSLNEVARRIERVLVGLRDLGRTTLRQSVHAVSKQIVDLACAINLRDHRRAVVQIVELASGEGRRLLPRPHPVYGNRLISM